MIMTMTKTLVRTALLALALALSPTYSLGATTPTAKTTLKCTPFKVWDGDTFDAKCGKDLEVVRVRLYQTDAPERSQPWGTQSRLWLSERVLNKPQRVVVETAEPGTAVYKKRVIARVYAPYKSVSVNRWSIREGMSWLSPGFTPKTDVLWKDYEKAKASDVGLWATVDPIPPWGWRHGQRHPKIVIEVPAKMMHESVDFIQASK